MVNYVSSVGVQQFSITIASGNTTGTASITAVGSGAYINYGGNNPSVTSVPSEGSAYLTLTNTDTITATRSSGTAGTIVITGSITDGDTTNLIKSVQYGTVTIALSGTSGTAPISLVTNANCAMHHLGTQDAAGSVTQDEELTAISLAAATVTAVCKVGAAAALVVGFVAIEYQSTCLTANAVQNISATSSASVTSWTASITSVVMNNAVSFWCGSTMASITTNLAESLFYGSLTAVGTYTINVNTGIADAKLANASIAEFNSGVLNSAVQRGTTTLTGVVTNNTAITSVNEAFAGLSWLGNTTSAVSAVLNEGDGMASLGYSGPVNVSLIAGVSSGSSNAITTPTAGNFLIVVATCGSGSTPTITGVTDSASQTYTQVSGATSAAAGKTSTIWYLANTTAGVTTLTVTGTNVTASTIYVTVYEFSGMQNTGQADASNHVSTQTASTTQTGPTITTTKGGDVIIVGCTQVSRATSVAYPYIFEGTSSNQGGGYYIPSEIVTNSQAVFTASASTSYGISAAAFFSNGLGQAVIVTKNNATANITGSWEVLEFPAYSSGTATTYSFSGASSGTVGVASGTISVTPTAGNWPAAVSIALTDASSGSFTTSPLTPSAGTSTPATFTYTPGATGSISLTPNSSGAMTDPSPWIYTSNAAGQIFMEWLPQYG